MTMYTSKALLLLVGLSLSSLTVYSQTCSTSRGIDLSQGNGPFSGLGPRDQGQLGTCYAHASSDLLSSYLRIGRINIYQTIVANDTSVNGGGPADVINSFANIGWACTDTSLYRNFFPITEKNIIGELQDTFIGTPIFYTVNANEKNGIARQNRIAEKAANIARLGSRSNGIIDQQEQGLQNFLRINKQIDDLESQIEALEKEKHWYSGNTEINQKISKINSTITQLKKKADVEHEKYVYGLTFLEGGNHLDSYSEDDAAEIVFHLINRQHSSFIRIMKNYGLESVAPSLAEFITDRVQHDAVLGYSYAGIMYPFKVMKKIMGQICPNSSKVKIPKNIRGMELSTARVGYPAIQDKIESLLEKSNQAVGISIQSSLLTGKEGEAHAVNIIGCRSSGKLTEYLIQNSWGRNCTQYKDSLQAKCNEGRVWIPSEHVMGSITNINWIQNKSL